MEKKSFKDFLFEKVSKQAVEDNMSDDEKYKKVDCSSDDLSEDEKKYCDRKRLLKTLSDFRIRNN